MLLHKFSFDSENPKVTITRDDGTVITIRPGDKSPSDGREVTAEDIKTYVSCLNSTVRNNIKHAKAPVPEKVKGRIKEWEKEHPGEQAAEKWNISLDAIYDGENDDADKSPLLHEVYKSSHPDNPIRDRVDELIDELTETQKRALIRFCILDMSLEEIASELGCSKSAISRAVSRAKEFIKNNF